ncbi:maleylacetate reductase [Rhodococcus sp. 06-1460-1B]|uniref:maleylacetate reductase n=1 Tax=Rhodococcus sp. 06-1460-1B TaxID=2022501 RepID=UPI000B9AA4DB|nr:maleylacetate reductase [Rhodococcus sp. 06-1460-1B]OZD60996.1 maleylacetate reductase [Rhodococcus sp. 06-1460-1B]
MLEFEHDSLAQRVLFGAGKAASNLAAEATRLGATSVMVIAGPAETELATSLCREIEPRLMYSEVVQHVPIETAEKARAAAIEHEVDLLVSIGGGSTTGLAKAVALTSGIPIVAIPTTYAGSEATNVWGLTEASRKTTGVDARVLPTTVIYDVLSLLTLPVELSVASGLNALAHSVDSMWAPRADPINSTLAVEAITALSSGLRDIKRDSSSQSGHEQTLYGAYLSAVAFASAGSGLHHKICHVLGGTYNMPHAQTHAIVLPHVLEHNAPYAPAAEQRIAAAFGTATAVEGLWSLRTELEAPTALRDYGLKESDLDEAVALVLEAAPASNPRPVTAESLMVLLRNAWAGTTSENEDR